MMKFAAKITAWQQQCGRHDLPWQNTQDPYRIWLSEIMLQQTQVSTVIGYYERFLQRFPTLDALAHASLDDVMPYWAGLGYYTRARNLHRCAQELVHNWNGVFPADPAELARLPGIGRSTASAISAFSYRVRAAIMDGNVKRVFTRHFGIEGDTNQRIVNDQLWHLAQQQIDDVADLDMISYTQGLMDLGATLCTRQKPNCQQCPIAQTCVAKAQNRQHELPTPKARKTLPVKTVGMLIIKHEHTFLLEKQAHDGIWGGLWSLPTFNLDQGYEEKLIELNLNAQATANLKPLNHAFSHYKLIIRPVVIQIASIPLNQNTSCPHIQWWTHPVEEPTLGLPAAIKKLLLSATMLQFR